MNSSKVFHYHFFFTLIVYFILFYIFSCCIAWGPSYTYMYTFFFPPFVLLRYKYLDIVLNATQQDLIVNPFQEQQFVSHNPMLPIPPICSFFPQAGTSLFSKSMIFFSVEMFICAVYQIPVTSEIIMVFIFLSDLTSLGMRVSSSIHVASN